MSSDGAGSAKVLLNTMWVFTRFKTYKFNVNNTLTIPFCFVVMDKLYCIYIYIYIRDL